MDIRQLEAADAPVYRAFRLRDTQATALFAPAGFVSFGVEPDAIRVDGISLGKRHRAIQFTSFPA